MDWPHSQVLGVGCWGGGYIKGLPARLWKSGWSVEVRIVPYFGWLCWEPSGFFDKSFNGEECSVWIETFAPYWNGSLNLSLVDTAYEAEWKFSVKLLLFWLWFVIGPIREPWGTTQTLSHLIEPFMRPFWPVLRFKDSWKVIMKGAKAPGREIRVPKKEFSWNTETSP